VTLSLSVKLQQAIKLSRCNNLLCTVMNYIITKVIISVIFCDLTFRKNFVLDTFSFLVSTAHCGRENTFADLTVFVQLCDSLDIGLRYFILSKMYILNQQKTHSRKIFISTSFYFSLLVLFYVKTIGGLIHSYRASTC